MKDVFTEFLALVILIRMNNNESITPKMLSQTRLKNRSSLGGNERFPNKYVPFCRLLFPYSAGR